MGGRGGYSGAKAARTTHPAAAKATLTSLRSDIDTIGQQMSELAKYATPSGAAIAQRNGETAVQVEKKANAYYKAQQEYNEIRQEYNRLRDTQMQQRNNQSSGAHTFVNSYGEATKREITSSTYNRAQKKLERRIQTWMKNYR
ncbi:MAG: hypothetical protein LUG44_01175 [Clostridiales bacterium]|nr:hypothetical protein [Clostridiales bacterium]